MRAWWNAWLVTPLLLASCDQRPLSWDTLLRQRITQERPDCVADTSTPGQLALRCGPAPVQLIDSHDIAQFCQRGPRDCEYAIDQAVLGLPAAAASAPQR